MRYQFIRRNASQFPISVMCRVLDVSGSGYYNWLDRPKSPRALRHDSLVSAIKEIHSKSGQTYGYRRVQRQLALDGVDCSEGLVCYLMRRNGIRVSRKIKFKVTTDSKHDLPISPNVLDRNFRTDKPNACWVGDITYIPTDEGWLYMAVVIDLYSRQVVGWSMNERITTALVVDAMQMAIRARRPAPGLVMHSDRGSQYASGRFQRLLRRNGMVSSMSRKGDPWDNAVAESFFRTLKTERTYWSHYATRNEARRDIFHYVELFYNRVRLHSSLGYTSPADYERVAAAARSTCPNF